MGTTDTTRSTFRNQCDSIEEKFLRVVQKPQKILRDHSLEIFNKTQWFLQIKSYLAICELSSSSKLVKFS
ncbi:hypothetical protein FFZ99_17875 [Leptospira interrogans]|nr:hypothetical protein FF006_17535 [Leptospira interrogans]TQE60907.1 hypothetical protein FFZ99_17875 [Leptospira interrogans]TQE63641.1 hypothetical protein FF001_17690 [Leptospira interrogans]TQE69330.1 hypothetical protein FF002_17740 [Leptospira interrogans]